MEGIQVEVRFSDGEVIQTTIKRWIYSSGDLIVKKVKEFTRFEFLRRDDRYYLTKDYLEVFKNEIEQHGCRWIDGYIKGTKSNAYVQIRRVMDRTQA